MRLGVHLLEGMKYFKSSNYKYFGHIDWKTRMCLNLVQCVPLNAYFYT